MKDIAKLIIAILVIVLAWKIAEGAVRDPHRACVGGPARLRAE